MTNRLDHRKIFRICYKITKKEDKEREWDKYVETRYIDEKYMPSPYTGIMI